MLSFWHSVVALGAVAILCVGCANSVQHPRPVMTSDTGMRAQDIRLRADQVTRVRASSSVGDSVMVILYSNFNEQDAFSFNLPKVKVKAGYRVDDFYDHDKNLTVNAQWNGQHYRESTQFPTYVHFVVLSLTREEALIEVSARLIEEETHAFINLPLTLLKIQGADLAILSGKAANSKADEKER